MSNNRGKRHQTRAVLLQALYQWHLADATWDEIYVQFKDRHFKKDIDFSYFKEVLSGIMTDVVTIDQTIAKGLDRTLEDLDPIVVSVLRLSTYELMYKKEIPFRVVINEALLLTKEFGTDEGYKYVNGVLDKLADSLRKEEKNNVKKKS